MEVGAGLQCIRALAGQNRPVDQSGTAGEDS